MTLSTAEAAILLHQHGTDNVALLASLGVSPHRITAWKGRAAGLNAYFYRFPAQDFEPVERIEYTDDEVYTMRWLMSKRCKLPLGIMAAHFFPGRTGYGIQKLTKRVEDMAPLPPDACLTMPRPLPYPSLGRITVPPHSVCEGVPRKPIPEALKKFII